MLYGRSGITLQLMNDASADVRISVRIPKESDLKQRIAAAVHTTGIPESLLVLRATEAVVSYIEQNGRITFPLEVREKAAAAQRLGRGKAEFAKVIPIIAAVLAGCCTLLDCELLALNLFF